MRGAGIVMVALVGCFSPKPPAGGPCADDGACPSGLVCDPTTNTCETTSRGDAGDPDGEITTPDAMIDAGIDAPRVDGCTPVQEICGNGIDEDCDAMDPACAANDRPDGAIDITAGGTFSGDALLARDDRAATCNPSSGRDLFYEVTLTAAELYYLDTFNSTFDSTIAVFAGDCSNPAAAEVACSDNACATPQTQLALVLPAGTSCIVVEQKPGATTGTLALHVLRGSRTGEALPRGEGTFEGDTCAATNLEDPIDQCDDPGTGGKDLAYWFTACPGETLRLSAETCNVQTDYDSALYVREVGGNQIACNDDACGNMQSRMTNVAIANGVLFWLVVDGFGPTHCGEFRLETNLE